jgi:hypothetical protein
MAARIRSATVVGIIELFEIAMTLCAAWIIVSGLVRSLRENHWLSWFTSKRSP